MTKQPSPSHEKRMAALASVGSAIILVTLKVLVAVATGSLGILSEALHVRDRFPWPLRTVFVTSKLVGKRGMSEIMVTRCPGSPLA